MKKQEIIILIGIPGSGKSTWAREFQLEHKSYVRVNRDDFRLMLKNETFCNFKVEEAITEMQNECIMTALSKKLNVIVDNTHVKIQYINDLVNLVKHNANVTFKVFDVSLEVCIERDSKRTTPVGREIITKMYKNFCELTSTHNLESLQAVPYIHQTLPIDKSKQNAFIFDIDGTLAHVNGKRDIFDFSKVQHDDVDRETAILLDLLVASNHKIIFLTGRDEACRPETLAWLEKHGWGDYPLFMRPLGNKNKDIEVKKNIYQTNIKPEYNIIGVFEDRVSVCTMWHKLGLKVYQVNQRKF